MDKLKLPIPVTVSGLATSLFQTSGFYTPRLLLYRLKKRLYAAQLRQLDVIWKHILKLSILMLIL